MSARRAYEFCRGLCIVAWALFCAALASRREDDYIPRSGPDAWFAIALGIAIAAVLVFGPRGLAS